MCQLLRYHCTPVVVPKLYVEVVVVVEGWPIRIKPAPRHANAPPSCCPTSSSRHRFPSSRDALGSQGCKAHAPGGQGRRARPVFPSLLRWRRELRVLQHAHPIRTTSALDPVLMAWPWSADQRGSAGNWVSGSAEKVKSSRSESRRLTCSHSEIGRGTVHRWRLPGATTQLESWLGGAGWLTTGCL